MDHNDGRRTGKATGVSPVNRVYIPNSDRMPDCTMYHWSTIIEYGQVLCRIARANGRLPCVDLWYDSIIWSVTTPRARQVFDVWRLPWRSNCLQDGVVLWGLLADVRKPRVPFGRDLSGIVVVLSHVNPSVTTWDLFGAVQVLEILVAELICSSELTKLGVSYVICVPEPLFQPCAP